MPFDIEELVAVCKAEKNIYIFGAGCNAKRLYIFLQRHGIEIKGFLVSDMSDNPTGLFGHAVTIVDMLSTSENLILVPVIKANHAYNEIFEHLLEHHITNIYFLVNEQLEFIRKEVVLYKMRDIFNKNIYCVGEEVSVERDHSILVMESEGGEQYHWRFRNAMIEEQGITNISSVFRDKTALVEFEEQYGKYCVFHRQKQMNAVEQGMYTVYMARSHVDKVVMKGEIPSWVTLIQVGAAFTNRDICKIKDNMGRNISDRNRIYSECTALYWMWKNAPATDYIGLCHYRRHFNIAENEIGQLRVQALDVLVTSPTFVNETVGTFFSSLTPKSDIEMMLEVIRTIHPKYVSVAEKFLSSRFFPPCNLFIMKYDIFQEYAQFVFSITFEIEKFYDGLGLYRRDRYMGYIVECLLGIFLMKNKDRLKIGYSDMKFYS